MAHEEFDSLESAVVAFVRLLLRFACASDIRVRPTASKVRQAASWIVLRR